MNTKEFAELRSKVHWTQSQVAVALGLSLRTISAWESSDPPRPLSPPDIQSIVGLFRPIILEKPLKKMTQQAFDAIPSEAVWIWLVNAPRRECVLLPEAVRIHDLTAKSGRAREYQSPTSVQSLLPPSLTTFPLLDAACVNLAGDRILEHPAKRYKTNRNNPVFKDGVCESMLHVPAFTPSAAGPQPVLLLSLENKLKDGKVMRPPKGAVSLYDPQEVEVAHKLADEFKERLLPELRLLEMID